VQVIEIVPPAVNTDLGGVGLHTTGEPLDAFADAVVARIAAGELEIGYGSAEQRRLAANAVFDEWFERMNRRPPRCSRGCGRTAARRAEAGLRWPGARRMFTRSRLPPAPRTGATPLQIPPLPA
jgi:hypothetical protein